MTEEERRTLKRLFEKAAEIALNVETQICKIRTPESRTEVRLMVFAILSVYADTQRQTMEAVQAGWGKKFDETVEAWKEAYRHSLGLEVRKQ